MTANFSAGAVLTAANLNAAINSYTINAQTGAGYTLVLTDAGKLVTLSNASAQNLTIPLNSSVAYATGTTIEALNIGTGTWTVTATGGVTLSGTTAIPTNGRVRLTKTGTDTWYSAGMGASAGAITSIYSTSFTTQSSVSLNNVFTGYSTFLCQINLSAASVAGSIGLRFRASAADTTTSTYGSNNHQVRYSDSTHAIYGTAALSYGNLGYASTDGCGISLWLFQPATSAKARWRSTAVGVDTQAAIFDGGGVCSQATAHDGFTIYNATGAGTITGTLNLFGLSA